MIKLLLLIATLAIFGWMFLKRVHDADSVEKQAQKADNQATRYVQTLQNDVKKAEDAQKKADQAVKKEADAVGQAVKDAEGK